MSGNEIAKQISLPVYADKLTQTPTKLNLFQVESQQPADSSYQTALKKSLDAEARRDSRRTTSTHEPNSRLQEPSTSRANQLGSERSEKQKRFDNSSQRTNSEERADRRVENERTPVSQSRTESKRDHAEPKSADPASELNREQNKTDSQTHQTEEKSVVQEPVSEPSANNESVTTQNDATSAEVQEQLDTFNQAAAELVNDNAESLSKPPASLTEQFALQDGASETEGSLEQQVLNTIQETQAVLTPPNSFSTEVLQNQGENAEQTPNVSETSGSLNAVFEESVSVNENFNADLVEGQSQSDNGKQSGGETTEQVINADQVNTEQASSQNTNEIPSTDLQSVTSDNSNVEANIQVKQAESKTTAKSESSVEHSNVETKAENGSASSLNEVHRAVSLEAGNVPVPEEKTDKSKETAVEKTATEENSQNQQSLNPAVNSDVKQSNLANAVTPETKGQLKPEANHRSSTTPSIAEVTSAQKTERQSAEQPQANTGAPKSGAANEPAQVRVNPTSVATASLGNEPTTAVSGKVVEAKTEAVQSINGTLPTASAKTTGSERAAARTPITQTTLPSANSTDFAERLADSVRVADKNNQTLKVKLTPPQLGSMQIEVAKSEGVVIARLEVQSSSAQQVIMEQISGLKESLQQHGNNVERIEVHVREPDQSEQNQRHGSGEEQERNQKQEQKGKGQGNQQSSSEQQTDQDETADEPTETRTLQTDEWQLDNLDVEI